MTMNSLEGLLIELTRLKNKRLLSNNIDNVVKMLLINSI